MYHGIIDLYNLQLSYPELSTYGPIHYDSGCNEPLVWGYRMKEEPSWNILTDTRIVDMLRCFKGESLLVIERLSPRKAIKKYGPITDRLILCGCWISITYGKTTFNSPCMETNRRLLDEDWLERVIPTAEMFDYPDEDLIDEDEMEYELDE